LITGSECTGGAETHLRDLVEGLQSLGHDCTVLAGPPDNQFLSGLRRSGITVRIVNSLRKPLHPVRDSVAFFEMLRELTILKPDLVAVHTAKAGFLGRVAAATLRVPCVCTPHGCSIVDRKTGRINHLFLALEYIAGRLGGTTIAVCRDEQRLVVENKIAKRGNVKTVYNGIPDSAVMARPASEPAVITMVARFEAPKDHAALLRAVSKLKHYQWRVRLAGSGTLLASARELAVRLGIEERVDFLGECSDIPRLLSESQIFVLMSRSEAFPISILEAMRAGLPVVASDVGGISEAVEDGATGFLIPSGDDETLSDRLALLLGSPGLRSTLGNNARKEYVARFTADVMVAKTLDVYAGVAKRRTESVSDADYRVTSKTV
jgi:glycosyltransferase involved in cell wall biosynthesis